MDGRLFTPPTGRIPSQFQENMTTHSKQGASSRSVRENDDTAPVIVCGEDGVAGRMKLVRSTVEDADAGRALDSRDGVCTNVNGSGATFTGLKLKAIARNDEIDPLLQAVYPQVCMSSPDDVQLRVLAASITSYHDSVAQLDASIRTTVLDTSLQRSPGSVNGSATSQCPPVTSPPTARAAWVDSARLSSRSGQNQAEERSRGSHAPGTTASVSQRTAATCLSRFLGCLTYSRSLVQV